MLEEEVGCPHAHTVLLDRDRLHELVQCAVGSQTPSLGVVERDQVGVLATHSRRPLPAVKNMVTTSIWMEERDTLTVHQQSGR